MIEAIPVGALVTIGDGIIGSVTAICVRNNNLVSYEVCWWNGRTRECKWLEAFEVQPDTTNKTRIGFT